MSTSANYDNNLGNVIRSLVLKILGAKDHAQAKQTRRLPSRGLPRSDCSVVIRRSLVGFLDWHEREDLALLLLHYQISNSSV